MVPAYHLDHLRAAVSLRWGNDSYNRSYYATPMLLRKRDAGVHFGSLSRWLTCATKSAMPRPNAPSDRLGLPYTAGLRFRTYIACRAHAGKRAA